MDAWKDALSRLEHHDIDRVHEVFEMSYNNLENEMTKSTFLLCGLYPDDFDIPKEDLVRYGWGLQLFNKKYTPTIGKARYKVNTCIEQLIHRNLLLESRSDKYIRLHDLVRAFILKTFDKVKHASIVNHGNMSEWPENDMSDSFKWISLTCTGMPEFPKGFKYPNLSVLKLMYGDKSLRFPEDFYGEMIKLQVISYERMMNLLLPLQCSNSLRTLCLHRCSLTFDFSSIENLLSLEVLSVTYCGIENLPSTFQKLKKLRLLDLTGCVGLSIDNGVLKNLVKLEELYMKVDVDENKAICFTDDIWDELAERSKNLSTLEIEFFGNNPQLKNMSFAGLERFKISVGYFLEMYLPHSFENTLMLVTNKDELVESRMNELFEKTSVLHLGKVDGMNDLEDIELESIRTSKNDSSFSNLRVLEVSECSELRYIFTQRVATALPKLENLAIASCNNVDTLIDVATTGPITFRKLEKISLKYLPNLSSFCSNATGKIELPQLKHLYLSNLPNLTGIYPKKLATSTITRPIRTKEINVVSVEDVSEVDDDNLNVLFPSHVIHTFNRLHKLKLNDLKRVEVVFEIGSPSSRELKTFDQNNLQSSLLPYLEDLSLFDMERTSHVWKHCNWNEFLVLQKQPPHQSSFHNLTTIYMGKCNSIKYLFSPHMASLFSSLKGIKIYECDGIEEVVSSIDDGDEGMTTTNTTLFPHLESLDLYFLKNLKRIGGGGGRNKGGSNEICSNTTTITTALDDQLKLFEMDDFSWSLCQYSRNIIISRCDALSSVIPSYALGHMQKLEKLEVRYCKSMIEVFETQGMNNIDGSSTSIDEGSGGNDDTTLTIPRLENITVIKLPNLKILKIVGCDLLEHIFTFSTLESLKQLKKLTIRHCDAMKVVVKEENGDQTSTSQEVVFPCLESVKLKNLPNLMGFFLGKIDFKWPLLENVVIKNCPQIVVFTSGQSTSPNFKNIQTSIGKYNVDCGLNVNTAAALHRINVVSEEDVSEVDDDNLNVLFPSHVIHTFNSLHELELNDLKRVEVVFEIGSPSSRELKTSDENNHQSSLLPYLEELSLDGMERMSHVWKHCNWNEFLVLQKQQPHQSSFRNLTNIYMKNCNSIKYLFSPHMASLFSSLKEVFINECDGIEEVVSSIDDGDEGMTTTNTTLFPHLESLHLISLINLKRIGGGGGRNKGGSNEICSNTTTTTTSLDDQLKIFEGDVLWSLCQYCRNIGISWCDALSSVIPSYALGQMQKLEELYVRNCKSMIEVFETQGMNNIDGSSTSIDEGSGGNDDTTLTIPRLENITLIKLPNLKILTIDGCDLLEHIFTFSTLESLKQLKELMIKRCDAMKVVVKDENGDQTSTSQEVVFPCLKSIKLKNLPNLMGFFLGKNDFKWPVLENVVIKNCPQMMVFTSGQSTSPNFKNIQTNIGKYSVECGLNLNTVVASSQGFEFGTNENENEDEDEDEDEDENAMSSGIVTGP